MSDWTPVETAPTPGRYIAVYDTRFVCRWHFATFDGGDWFDNASGRQIEVTHWMRFPAGPSESRP